MSCNNEGFDARDEDVEAVKPSAESLKKRILSAVEISQFSTLESTVSWIEQDSTSKPSEYLEESNTNIFGE
jgi:hypothetical protein